MACLLKTKMMKKKMKIKIKPRIQIQKPKIQKPNQIIRLITVKLHNFKLLSLRGENNKIKLKIMQT